jgi:hypothetical protein
LGLALIVGAGLIRGPVAGRHVRPIVTSARVIEGVYGLACRGHRGGLMLLNAPPFMIPAQIDACVVEKEA